MVRLLLLTLLMAAGIIISSCNAPHENPVDPDNPDNILYYIEGNVKSAEADSQPLTDVLVTWSPENISATSSQNGYFKISCEQMKDGWLYFDKPGLLRDSLYIKWGENKHLDIDKKLNYTPVLDSIYTYSSIKNKYSLPENQIIIEAYASDKDNDIDSLFIVNDELLIDKPLQKISSRYFQGSFNDYDLGLTSLEQAVGKRLELYASVDGKRYHIGNSYIKRIIPGETETISPANSDTLETQNPILTWKRFEPGFAFTYMIEIYTDEPEPKLLWKKDSISQDDITIDVTSKIAPTSDNNRFFWVIWCIDEYKDRIRSKPAGFVILK